LHALRDGDTDFAVITAVADTQWPDFVERRKIMSMPLLVVARQGHPLAQARSMSMLHAAEWLVPCEPGDEIDKGFSAYFHSLGLSAPSRIMRCQALAPSVALIAKTDVICVATQPTFELEMKRRRIRELKIHETFPDLDVYVVQRRERPLTSAASRFLACLEEAAAR
jgi:DNA-binding transcriptional LysR family regulator